jgi:hypothetical protein
MTFSNVPFARLDAVVNKCFLVMYGVMEAMLEGAR